MREEHSAHLIFGGRLETLPITFWRSACRETSVIASARRLLSGLIAERSMAAATSAGTVLARTMLTEPQRLQLADERVAQRAGRVRKARTAPPRPASIV
jgi:hypothetical protein